MTYQEAIAKSLTVRWKLGTCEQGEKCWCRSVRCETPIMFDEEELWVVAVGRINKETAEHIVMLHNREIEEGV